MKTKDLKIFSDKLHNKMKEQLEVTLLENQDGIVCTSRSLSIIKLCLNELKVFIQQYQFQSEQEEIELFKEIKPLFSSQYLYHERILFIKINEPIGSNQELVEFYYRELKSIQDFAKVNADFNLYHLTNLTHLDELYFMRRDNSGINPDMDDKFTTGYDNTLATLVANQLLRDYLLAAIKKAMTESQYATQPLLTWTGPKTYLIELIYALQLAESFNNGKADIKHIASMFESVFNISLGNYYRVFQEIRLRKNGKAYFLDQLKDKFIQRMDELDQN